LNLET